jgi:hypothetical protein
MAIRQRETPESIRSDIVKRLFAVAVSVGFAASLSKMRWVQAGTFPDGSEQEHIAGLLTALMATMLSWDGYLTSIARKPLRDFWRFFIDVCLIFTYMFLLMTSRHTHILAWGVVAIFCAYVVWDVLTIKQFPRSYASPQSRRGRIITIYTSGFLGATSVSRGPIITATWFIYFLVLALFTIIFGTTHTFLICAGIAAGLISYRADKQINRNARGGIGATIARSLEIIFLWTFVFWSLHCLG